MSAGCPFGAATGHAVNECPLCRDGKPLYDWGETCCLARYIAGQPTQERRRLWLDRIKEQQGKDLASSVEALARSMYESMRNKHVVTGLARTTDVRLKGKVSLKGRIALTQSKYRATDPTP